MGREGRCWKFGDSVLTDQVVKADRVLLNTEEMAKRVLGNLNPEFPEHVKKGDILVTGKHFGRSPGRAVAPEAIEAAGVSAVTTKYISRLFYRNCFEIGLLLLECEGITQRVSDGGILYVSVESGIIVNKTTGGEFRARPTDPFLMEMLEAGRLIVSEPRIDEYQIQEPGGDTVGGIKSRVWRFDDDIPMGQIVRVDRALGGMGETAGRILGNYDPELPEKVQKGDILMIEKYLGRSSGRAVAPRTTRATGVGAVAVGYASRLFYRNTFEIGLPLMECLGIIDHVSDGNCPSVDMTIGKIKNEATGDVLQARPADSFLMEMLGTGELITFDPHISRWSV